MRKLTLIPALLGLALIVPGGAAPRTTSVRFDDKQRGRLVITAPGYRIALSKRSGALLELVERPSGERLVRGQDGCLWAASATGDSSSLGGCLFTAAGPSRFSYRWDRATSSLTLTYHGDSAGADAVVTLTARDSYIDLRLVLENHSRATLEKVVLPADLLVASASARAGYAPNYLPGVRLAPRFFSRVGDNVRTYPSRWAFADYLALDLGAGHLALSSVNPEPSPLAPVELGFVHAASGACSGDSFCVTHAFQTWIRDGETWTSPVVRIRVKETANQTIQDYRRDNGIDAYPSLDAKLGPRLASLARAPLIKADPWQGPGPFAEWGPDLRRLPSPALVHPVAFQPRGHDENFPDFLPPDPDWGTTADFRSVVDDAHSLGQLVMPYLNVSWWNPDSPTLSALPAPLKIEDIAVRDQTGQPVFNRYSEHRGLVVSPFDPFVRDRIARLLEQWRTDVPTDCLFFDQIGARPWLRDFNPASPTPLAYDDGWLALMAAYSDRCLMVEDGWDRLARSFVGFHGGLLLMQREHAEPDEKYGVGNWQAYPLASWLLHDKVLLYQHDLYEGTMTADREVLTWNMAFGFMLSYSLSGRDDPLSSPWVRVVGAFQRALGPHYAGRPLTGYKTVADDVTLSTFGSDYSVTTNWNWERSHEADGFGIAPIGFLARAGTDVVAGVFAGTFNGAPLSPGPHYLIVERGQTDVTVRQLLGEDTPVAIDPPRAWRPGEPLRVSAFGPNAKPLGEVEGAVEGRRFVFRMSGRGATFYRVSAR